MTSNPTASVSSTQYLERPEGSISYDVEGDGPLIVLVPGMGDLRGGYRFLAPVLREAGYRVASTDLRGHGDSDATFSSYGDVETAADVTALIEKLGGPAVIIGNSMSAGAGALTAANHPDQVTGLVLVGPFVRDASVSPVLRLLFRVAMARPWVAASWKTYLPKLYAGQKPADFDEYRTAVVASLRRPGHAKALSLTTRLTHAPVEARLADVAAPVMVIMGELDPDFKDPAAEADWIGKTLHGEVVMVPDSGHYPQSQQPQLTADAVLRFMDTVARRA